MRYAIISDIHANLEAYEAVLLMLEKLDIGRVLCLGDVVGYNADPAFCVDKTGGLAYATVRGNHDKAAAGLMSTLQFNQHAKDAVRWTTQALDAVGMDYLKKLFPGPLAVDKEILLCHGAPQDEDLYLVSTRAVQEGFEYLQDNHPETGICFFGHTHVPVVFDSLGGTQQGEGTYHLETDRVYLINPGSIGQPRDGNPDAAFGVYDDDERSFSFFRVPYAFTETQEKIIKQGLPSVLAQRLAVGR